MFLLRDGWERYVYCQNGEIVLLFAKCFDFWLSYASSTISRCWPASLKSRPFLRFKRALLSTLVRLWKVGPVLS